MGRTGSALDNAAIESYHSTLEFELLSRTRFATRAQARPAVIAWIEEYNTEPSPLGERHDHTGRLRARPAPSRRQAARPAAPPPQAPDQERHADHDQEQEHDAEQEHDGGGCAARKTFPTAARWSPAPRSVRARPSGLKDHGR